jgi:hypothetical protein
MVRIEARRDGVATAVTVPMGPDTLLEPVAATVDTLLDLTARFGRASVRVPPITFSLNDAGIAHGRVAVFDGLRGHSGLCVVSRAESIPHPENLEDSAAWAPLECSAIRSPRGSS